MGLLSKIAKRLGFKKKPELVRKPIRVAQGQAALTARLLKEKDEFEAILASDTIYQEAKAKRDKAKLPTQKKAWKPHQAEMEARMNEILARGRSDG